MFKISPETPINTCNSQAIYIYFGVSMISHIHNFVFCKDENSAVSYGIIKDILDWPEQEVTSI